MSESDYTIHKGVPAIKVTILRGAANKSEFSFSEPFCIGRDETCSVQIQDNSVSRVHAEVYLREGMWWIRDLNSANGTFVEGRKIDRLPLTKRSITELGIDGPVLSLEPEALPEAEATYQKKIPSVTQYMKRYFGRSAGEDMGQHTLFIRQAFKRVQKRQKSKYYAVIAAAAVLLLIAIAFVFLQQKKIKEQRQMAVDLFYNMKTLELEIDHLKAKIQSSGNTQDLKDVEKSEISLKEMDNSYSQFLDKLGVYRKHMSEEEKLIMHVARIFGECELRLPEGFIDEVGRYIKKWQSTDRLATALAKAKENEYDIDISLEMGKYGLPPHFFYLALQESDFDTNACGPETKYGFAKGMWQFIPDTALSYGLQIGPLYPYRRYDPRDERHDFNKSTQAAARYIKDIYDTEAQASGLLVIASYNWGETRVRELIRKMPQNPRERNFWLLLEKYINQIPEQTYDYVFYIFSAAVIGENPRFFGFNLDNPLAQARNIIGN